MCTESGAKLIGLKTEGREGVQSFMKVDEKREGKLPIVVTGPVVNRSKLTSGSRVTNATKGILEQGKEGQRTKGEERWEICCNLKKK